MAPHASEKCGLFSPDLHIVSVPARGSPRDWLRRLRRCLSRSQPNAGEKVECPPSFTYSRSHRNLHSDQPKRETVADTIFSSTVDVL
jgi:hypothetical protein